MNEFQNLAPAIITALAGTFTGIGVGALTAFLGGTDTVPKRFRAMIFGMLAFLAMFFAQIWLGYHGFKI
jgi:ABC-type dipeptide/oligopeptide/nickel transport system permease subunit